MKHAYLIIAHSSFTLLKELIGALDDIRKDIYLHIDSKVDWKITEFHTNFSSLFVLPTRIDARWGDYSLVQVELLLFETAYKNGRYAYYLLLSGVDFPIKNQDFIHHYCEIHQGVEYIGFVHENVEKEIKWNSQHYFLFSKDFGTKNIVKKSS